MSRMGWFADDGGIWGMVGKEVRGWRREWREEKICRTKIEMSRLWDGIDGRIKSNRGICQCIHENV